MEISFPSSDGSFQLYGDLFLPPSNNVAGQLTLLPAIVIVAGSGPIDRNGNAPTMKLNAYSRFAEHVMSSRSSDRSIAVLSYDKRGVGKSKKAGDKNLYYRAGMMDLVADAVEAVRYLSSHPRIDKQKIAVLGHSEGAIIMPLICQEVKKSGMDPIFGCIFYCGLGENVKDAMSLQMDRIAKEVQELTGPKGWVLRRFVSKEKMDKQCGDFFTKINSPEEPEFVSMQCGLVKQPAKWLREHRAFNSQECLAENISCHCLAITGQKDVQARDEFCTPEKAAELVPHATSIEVHRPANLTHALRSLEGPSKILDLKKDYARMSKMPLDAELLSITDAWCDRMFGIESK